MFEEKLAAAMAGKQLPLARTHSGHLAASRDGSAPTIVTDAATSLRTDGNNVDIDAEMANTAKNQIYYNAVAQMLGRYYSNLKSAIRGGS